MGQNLERKTIGTLVPPARLMMTPGPSSIDPRVYRALSAPVVGHLDPWFKTCMDETQTLMRQVFRTENRVTMPLSASGSGGIEAGTGRRIEWGPFVTILNPRDRELLRFEQRDGMLRNVLDKSVPLLVVEHVQRVFD